MSEEHKPALSHWSDAFEPEAKGFVQNRGWHTKTAEEAIAEAIKAYQNVAKLVGAPPDEMVRVPKDTGAPEWAALHARLGKPADASGYSFGEGVEEKFAATMREAAFNANLPAEAAARMVKAVQDFRAAEAKAAASDAGFQAEEERRLLEANWGSRMETNKDLASRTAQALGVSPDAIAALEKTVGYAKTMETFLKLAVARGEARFITGDSPAMDGVMSAEQASLRKAELMNDPAWVKSYLSGDATKLREMTDLIRRAAGK